jgi:RNA polymerase sigma-70 factor, ECF subfamily
MAVESLNRLSDAGREHEPQSDGALAARAARGDERAFERIMRAHNRLLYRTARSILRDDEEAEDVLQEAYVKAFYALASFKSESKLSTWLTRIVINEALARRRTLAHAFGYANAASVVHLDSLDGDALFASAPRAGPEAMAMREELSRLIQMHIERLPTAFRIVFVLRALEELTVEETAQCLDIPAATVRTRFLRARRMLRAYAAHDIEAALDASFAFGGARCDRTVRRVLTRIRDARAPSG